MMDEQLIAEVEQHGVIYNRQKYSINNMGVSGGAGHGGGSNGSGVNKYETKEEAWQIIAIKLQSDVETCKKRWKYLRERYVSQRKQGDPPVYEHLSRPYLEKMKFLDQHIQPRKSYRNVSNFLTSPNASSSFNEYNMDSSKSNGSTKNHSYPMHQQPHQLHSTPYQQESIIKTEEDQTFRDFAATVASQQLQQMDPHHPQFNGTAGGETSNGSTALSMGAVPSHVNNYNQYREIDNHSDNPSAGPTVRNEVPSSTSSSMKSASPQPPPTVATNLNGLPETNDDHQFVVNGSSNNTKKPRVQITNQYLDTSDSDDNTSPSSTLHRSNKLNENHSLHSHQSHQHQQQQQQQQYHIHQQQQQQNYKKMLSNVARNMTNMNHVPSQGAGLFPSNNDILFSLYQQMTPAAAAAATHQDRNTTIPSSSATRSSEHLLGELVTSELLKMNKERRKTAQKRILEILFFED